MQYVDANATVKINEAEIKKKQNEGEIDWEHSAIEARKSHLEGRALEDRLCAYS